MENDSRIKHLAFTVTRWVGSPQSIIIHTAVFAGSFLAVYGGALTLDRMLLVLTTIVSLEAIYLAIFIQMTLNYTSETISEVEHDIDEIQEDIDEIQEDVGEIQEDVDELQEDVEEMTEEEKEDAAREKQEQDRLDDIKKGLEKLMRDVERLQSKNQSQ